VDCYTGLTWPHIFLSTWAWDLPIRSALESGLPRGYSCCGNRGIWVRSLASERIPALAIFYRESLCLMRHYFLTGHFSGVKLIRGGLFRPKLTIHCLSDQWHIISWHYTFKEKISRTLLDFHIFISWNFDKCTVSFTWGKICTSMTSWFSSESSGMETVVSHVVFSRVPLALQKLNTVM
jgi:hypothetical protein